MSFTTSSEKTSAAYRRGWDRIWGKVQGGILLLPPETSAVVVQYSPYLKICSILEPRLRKIVASYDKETRIETTVKTPKLVLNQILKKVKHCNYCTIGGCPYCSKHPSYCFCHECLDFLKNKRMVKKPLRSVWYLYELTDQTDTAVRGRPYRIGNVYPNGKLCFGKQALPGSPRQCNFNFWNSSFNADFSEVHPKHDRARCSNKHPSHNNIKHVAGHAQFNPHPTKITCRKNVVHKCDCLETSDYHDGDCSCAGRSYAKCACPCKCSCCLLQCECRCKCECCRRVCNCNCACNINEVFARQLQGYRSTESRVDLTSRMLGKQYLASSKRVEGVFITCNDELLDKYPNAVCTERNALIGLATLNHLDEWRVDFKDGFSRTFTSEEVFLV